MQETHWVSDNNLKLPGFLLAGSIHSKKYGMATFVLEGLTCNDLKPERRVLYRFPHSHHRPSIKVPSLVQPVADKLVRRWNFRKANWQSFMAETERRSASLSDPEVADVDVAYASYCKVILRAAKLDILRGYNNNYIPGWDEECSCLLRQHQQASSSEEMEATAITLLQKLDDTRRTRWSEVAESIDFTHSSRKAWQTINLLSGRRTPRRCPLTADVSHLLKNGHFTEADKNFTRLTLCEVLSLSRAASTDANLSGDLTAAELSAAINKLKLGKSPGQDNIHPRYPAHSGHQRKLSG
ncbi:hypothetical protein AOLI_G00085780 [Acnodon oligacanthus]